MTIFGWDASDFDWGRGPVDVSAAVNDGITFFTHKATEGTHTQHIHYAEALNRALMSGMPCMGAYMVPRTPGNNGNGSLQAQVDYFLSYLDSQTPWWRSIPEFFLQVDTEKWGYDDVDPAIGAQVCDLLRTQTGKWVIHYAPRWAYGDSIPGNHPLWASSYGSNPAVPYRQAYPGDGTSGWTAYSGRTPAFLQFGSRVTIGTQPGCDVNAFRGTLDQLRTLVGAAVPPPAPSVRSSAPRILCIGDSITAGYGDSSGLGYRRELGRMLTAAGVAHEFVVRAPHSATTQDWLQWIEYEVTTVQPDLVLLLVGTNDAKLARFDPFMFEAAYRRLLDLTFIAKPDVKVCAAWIQSTTTGWNFKTQMVADAITRQTWPTPASWNGPMRSGVVGIASMRGLPTAYLFDGVHPTNDGYDAMGWQWFRALRGYLALPTS